MLLRKQKTWKMDFLSSSQVTGEGPGSASHKEAKYGENKERRVVNSMEIKILGGTTPNQRVMEN